MSILLRSKKYHLVKRVPTRYQPVESRKQIWLSLHTDSESVAKAKAPMVWEQQIEIWESRLAGDTADAEKRHAAMIDLAAKRGHRYLDVAQVTKLSDDDLVARVAAIPKPNGQPVVTDAHALLGTSPAPAITVSRAMDLYFELNAANMKGKSDDQKRRAINPVKKAIRNFIDVVGDKPISEITRDDMLDFRKSWSDRIEFEGLTANSGNKDLGDVSKVLRSVNEFKRLGLDLPLGGLTFKAGEKRTRPPFSDKWIVEKLLAPGALDGLNGEARAIFLGMVNTGCRPSELAGLTANTLHLDCEVPHVSIESELRKIKTANAKRTIPLVGVSLEALKCYPDGFPRYATNSATLSATINKFLDANGLKETERHTLYSLRHSFEDRTLAAGIDERVRRDLMGHTLSRERYGAGATLEHKAKLLSAIAL